MKIPPSSVRRLALTILFTVAAGCGGGSGAKPADGSAGTTGDAGATGTAGTTDAAGTTGTAGTTGAAGTTGTAGTTGIAGNTGAGGGTDGGTDAASPRADAGGSDASATTSNGTVTVTEISVNGNAKPDFTCVAKGSSFIYSPIGTGGIMSIGCNNGAQTPTDIIAAGLGGNAAVGTQTEKTLFTAASLQSYTTLLSASGTAAPATTHYTITTTAWDPATLHVVGTIVATWDKPATGTASYGGFKAAFDVTLKAP